MAGIGAVKGVDESGVVRSKLADRGYLEKDSVYGKTVGEPKLSDKAQDYYEKLKKKFGNYDFVLVSRAEKENAKANAGRYANGFKTVVLIDEDKIEKMAVDENYRNQYEGILSGAGSQLEQMKKSMEQSGAPVKGFGMQINDNGTASFFAVLKQSTAMQKERIERKHEQNRAEKKAAQKADAKKALAKRTEEKKTEAKATEKADTKEVTITANSLEELLAKLEEYSFSVRSDSLLTADEKQVGQHIDFKG